MSCRRPVKALRPPHHTADSKPAIQATSVPGDDCNSVTRSSADCRNESVGPLGEWSLGSHYALAWVFASGRLLETGLSQCRRCHLQHFHRQAAGGDTVSINQTQRLRCVARSACSIASTCPKFGRRPPSDLSQSRCDQIAASLPLIHGHGCHASFRGVPVCCCNFAAPTGVSADYRFHAQPPVRCQNSTCHCVVLQCLSFVMSASRVCRLCI